MYYYTGYRGEPTMPLSLNLIHYATETAESSLAFFHHNHKAFEIVTVLRGKVSTTLNGQQVLLSAGESVVISPYQFHSGEWLSEEPSSEYVCCTMDLELLLSFQQTAFAPLLQELLRSEGQFRPFFLRSDPDCGALFAQIQTIDQTFPCSSAVDECRILSMLYGLLAFLFERRYEHFAAAEGKRRNTRFLGIVAQYLDQHYREEISSRSVSEALHMEHSYFCRNFRKYFGNNFSNYLCNYRVVKATEYYRQSELPIAQIASAVGFSDYCYFSRSFRKYVGISPACYFGRWKA